MLPSSIEHALANKDLRTALHYFEKMEWETAAYQQQPDPHHQTIHLGLLIIQGNLAEAKFLAKRTANPSNEFKALVNVAHELWLQRNPFPLLNQIANPDPLMEWIKETLVNDRIKLIQSAFECIAVAEMAVMLDILESNATLLAHELGWTVNDSFVYPKAVFRQEDGGRVGTAQISELIKALV
jgi:hypothetical protein